MDINGNLTTMIDLKEWLFRHSRRWHSSFIDYNEMSRTQIAHNLIRRINAAKNNGTPHIELAESIDEILGLRHRPDAMPVEPQEHSEMIKSEHEVPDLERVEALAKEGKSAAEAAETLEVKLSTFKNWISSGVSASFVGVREAWLRGRAACATPPKRGGGRRGPHITVAKKIEAKEPRMPTPPPATNGNGLATHSKQIELAGGGQIVVSFKGDVFDLLPSERDLLTGIGEQLRTFAAAN